MTPITFHKEQRYPKVVFFFLYSKAIAHEFPTCYITELTTILFIHFVGAKSYAITAVTPWIALGTSRTAGIQSVTVSYNFVLNQ